jgi:osmotically-inducible protein OsmY
MRSDEQLRRDVLNELKSDEQLGIDELDVRVERTVVTLTGRAQTPGQSWHALEVARRIAGLARVANKIAVENGQEREQ